MVLATINQNSYGAVCIVDEELRLVGLITDGDLRRGFLSGLTLESDVMSFVNSSPVKIRNDDRHEIRKLMSDGIKIVPVVNEKNILYDIFLDGKARETISNPFVIMAGGKGTRLYPHTENIPKPMVKIAGKPMLQIILERAREQGFKKIFLSLNHKANIIREYFQDGRDLNLDITYFEEDKPLGTAGSLKLMSDHIKDDFIVTNADVITDLNYRHLLEYHKLQKQSITMSVREHIIRNEFGVVDEENGFLVGFTEKPLYKSLVNAGVYVVGYKTLKFLDENESIGMPEFIQRAVNSGHKCCIYQLREAWSDVGRPDDLEKINLMME